VASIAAYGVGPFAFAAMWWLRSRGLIADTPLWVFAVILVLGAVVNYGSGVAVRRHPDSTLCVHLRVAAATLVTAATIYAVGWGPLVVIAYALGSAELLRTVGPRSTRANLGWNWVAIGAGQAAIAAGWAPTVIDSTLAHAVAVTGAVLLATVTKLLGQAAAATEAAEDLVRERALHFEALIAHAADLIGVVRSDGTIVSMSPAVTSMLGYAPDDLVGQPIGRFLDPSVAHEVADRLRACVDDHGTVGSGEVRLRHADGGDRLVGVTMTTPGPDWGDHVILNVRDITTQRDLESRLRHDARHDSLTGLLNRKAFGETSERSCAGAARSGRTVGMLYVDLDGFKEVNDSYGHDAGDRVLCEAGQRLSRCLRPGETLARLGGDEFAVLIDDVRDDRAVQLAEAILSALVRPVEGFPGEVRVGASIGIALRSSDGIEMSTLLRDADAAMYEAKRNGRSRWEMNEPVVEV